MRHIHCGTKYWTVLVATTSVFALTCSRAAAPTPVEPSPPTVSIVIINGAAPEIVGSSSQFTLSATFSDGSRRDFVPEVAVWDSSNTNIATVLNGFIRAISPGDVDIRATYQGVTGTRRLSIQPAPTRTLFGVLRSSANGSAVTGAAISILDGPNTGRSTTTDGNGYYSMGNLSTGTFTVEARKSGFLSVTQTVTLSLDLQFDFSITPIVAPQPMPVQLAVLISAERPFKVSIQGVTYTQTGIFQTQLLPGDYEATGSISAAPGSKGVIVSFAGAPQKGGVKWGSPAVISGRSIILLACGFSYLDPAAVEFRVRFTVTEVPSETRGAC